MKKKILFLLLTTCVFLEVIHAQETSPKKKESLCVLPGSIPKFKDALTDAKLHYYTNGGKTKLDIKKAELECNLDYFTIINNKMVLISSGQKKDRTEIRQDKNLSLNDYSAMFFSATIEKVPFTEKRKGITIGQIHNDTKGVKRPLLRVEIAGGNDIRTVVTSSYLKGEGKVIKDSFTSFTEKDTIECIKSNE